MKSVLVLCCVVVALFLKIAVANQDIHGEIPSGGYIAYSENVRWISSTPDIRISRWVRFPRFEADESTNTIVAGVVVSHSFLNTTSSLAWGGPGQKYVGVEIESGVGEDIDSFVEIFVL